MAYLLNVAYLIALLIASPWLLYSAIFRRKYRHGWGAKLLGHVPRRDGDRFCIWLHAVSVGEINVLQPLIEVLEELHPDWELVISTTTQTGFDLARQKYAPRSVFFCPMDFSWATSAAVRGLRPNLLILVELEIWPNLIRSAQRYGSRVALVNGRLSEKSFRGYRRIARLLKSTLARIDMIAAQTETYAERFRVLGTPPKTLNVTGSLKFDGAETDRDNPRTRQLMELAGIGKEDYVFLAGSTQAGEERAAIRVFQSLSVDHPRLRLVVVPRHPQRFDEVAREMEEAGLKWVRRTELETDRPPDNSVRAMLVDVVGELGAWWGTCHIAFVGGSWGSRGGQNMIEPAAYGAAVSFGPRTENFRDVVTLLLQNSAAVVVEDEDSLANFVAGCLTDRPYANAMGRRARDTVLEHRGATQRTVQAVERLLGQG